MSQVEIKSLTEVWIDGANAGQIMDVIRNHPEAASDVQRALSPWWDAVQGGHAQAIALLKTQHETDLATAQADKAQALADAQAAAQMQSDAAIAAIRQQLDAANAERDEAIALLNAVGLYTRAQQAIIDQRKAALQAQISELQQQHDQLIGKPSESNGSGGGDSGGNDGAPSA